MSSRRRKGGPLLASERRYGVRLRRTFSRVPLNGDTTGDVVAFDRGANPGLALSLIERNARRLTPETVTDGQDRGH